MIGTVTELAALQRMARSGTGAAAPAREQLRDLGYIADQAYVAFTYAESHVATAQAGLADGSSVSSIRRRLHDAASGYDRAVAYAELAFGVGNWTREVAVDRASTVRRASASIVATNDDAVADARLAAQLLDLRAADSELARGALGRIDLTAAVTRS